MQGKIIKGIGGFYYVDCGDGRIYACRAKGIFRKQKMKPLVGDNVEFVITHEGDMEGSVENIFPDLHGDAGDPLRDLFQQDGPHGGGGTGGDPGDL